jgi:ATP-dependent helicase/nuclease subunit A
MPCAEINIVCQPDEKLGIDALRMSEARIIAERISQIVSSDDYKIASGTGDELRSPGYGDIGILFQVSTSFEIYERALAARDIPYLTVAGRGFYDRQEITDLTNLVSFLASPTDSLRLAAVLRSPLFAVSDETLLRLRLTRKPLWEALSAESPELFPDESEPAQFALGVLQRLGELAGRASIAEIISTALAETGYLATLMALPHGDRRVANAGKFLEQADALANLTLSEFVERIGELRVREAREGEATIEETGAVRLMTVHKAKGLEFPVVWIADAAYPGFQNWPLLIAHPEFGFSADVKAEDGYGADLERPASYDAIRFLEEKLDSTEKRRLLYVAATRARDYLFVSGGLRTKLRGDHWLGLIAKTLGLNDSERPNQISFPGGGAAVRWHTATDSNTMS